MTETPPAHAWFSRGWIAVPVIALVSTMLAGVVSASPTQSVGDLQQQAAQVASQLDALNMKASQLDEQYNDASIELQQLQSDLAASQRAVADARAALDGHRSTARQYAIDAFVAGDRIDQDVLNPADDTTGNSRRRIYLSAVSGDRQEVIAEVTKSEQDLNLQERTLEGKTDSISAKKATLEKSKSQLQSTIDQQQQLQESVKGRLADAVAKEQARREAEALAAAQRAAAAAQQAAAARATAAQQAATARGTTTTSRSTTTAGRTPGAPKPSAPSFPSGNFAPPSAVPPGAAGAIAAAKSQLGVPYRWGAASPGVGFDCSGLVMWAYGRVGVSLPHSSSGMYRMTQRISIGQLQPGDLVFNGHPVHHVGIYIGGGQMIHAPHSGDVVKISSIGYSGSVSFGRL